MQAALWHLFLTINAVLAWPSVVKRTISPCVSFILSFLLPRLSMFSFFAARAAVLWVASPLFLAILFTYLFPVAIDARSLQCAALSLVLDKKVSYPASSAYVQSSSSYWSKQEASLVPSCIITPTDTRDVVTVVRMLGLLNRNGFVKYNFAIRGGGHTPWAGSANVNGGVTIDMRSISDVAVNEDKTVAFVGAGAIWGDVYQKMDSLGLAVVGARGSSIGVGGLLTGGNETLPLLRFDSYTNLV